MWHILSIGRDPMLLESRRLLLEAAGYQVVIATTLEAAVAACAEQHFDAVVICHSMDVKEREHVARELAICVPTAHILQLNQYEDLGYDPLVLIHRVQQVASAL